MNDFQFPAIKVTPPNLEEANRAVAQLFGHLRGLKMYNAAEIEAIKAAAYDEGFTACAGEHTKQREDPGHPITRVNPYKAPHAR
jgi:hypothetical protein